MKIGIIYKSTSPNGKMYIGRTINKLLSRIRKHYSDAFNKNNSLYNTKFSRAIRKYGKENFKWEIIYDNVPEKYINNMEVVTIQWYDTQINGYNTTSGGEGRSNYKLSDEIKKKISIANSGSNNGMYGYKMSEKEKQHLSKLNSGITNPFYGKAHTKKTKDKLSKALIGKKHTNDTKKKISEASNKLWAENRDRMLLAQVKGENHPNSKLNWVKVHEIRRKYSIGLHSYKSLAKEYNVSNVSIANVINNKTWKEK